MTARASICVDQSHMTLRKRNCSSILIFFVEMGIDPKALRILGKCSTTEPCSEPECPFIWVRTHRLIHPHYSLLSHQPGHQLFGILYLNYT